MKSFEAEMITIRGAIFGRLTINAICLSFKSEDRRSGLKYRFGSTPYNQISKRINKKWPLDSIKEVLVKRYNLMRQAVEIYFRNSKSVFFCLFRRPHLKKFLDELATILHKNPLLLHIEVVRRPEGYFAEKKYRERWLTGDLSNFEYLMLLNKYSGRSFNDLSQYPVFPWILKDYTSDVLTTSLETVYRPLDTTMGAISPSKRKCADEKLSVFVKASELRAYQFGSHYLPGRVVLGYMLRLEPYASLLMNFEMGHTIAVRMFHLLRQAWLSCVNDVADNKELIPEFYYLPEVFGNYNFYQYGTKEADDELPDLIKKKIRVRVDQVVLPPWAKNGHQFVRMNILALESRYVSLNLEKWIDLIFGEKQQDMKSYNMYKELCDEEAISARGDQLTESQITEIQEFGINPIKIFVDKHPSRNEKAVRAKTQYALFAEPIPGEERLFALIRVHNFPANAVIFIDSYEKRVVTVLSGQRACRSKEGYINMAHEKSIVFEKRDVGLFPYKKIFNEAGRSLSCDAQRCFATLDNGNTMVTCKHYDNSCKLVDLSTGEVTHSLFFHKAMVNAVAVIRSKDCIFTASNDGVLAVWLPKKFGFSRPAWYACDHNMGVVSVDACEKLDMVASGSADGTIALRTISSGKFVRLIRPALFQRGVQLEISHVRLSYRGYIILIAKCKNRKLRENDYMMTFSINGEEICVKQESDLVHALIMDESGYQMVTGGMNGRLLIHNILTLDVTNMLEMLDGEQANIEETLGELLGSGTAITAMELTQQDSCQQLLIGLSTGSFYTYKYSPRLIGSKIFETLHGIM